MAETTPIAELVAKFREWSQKNAEPSPMGEVPPFMSGTANGLEIAAEALEAALAAVASEHRETAQKLVDAWLEAAERTKAHPADLRDLDSRIAQALAAATASAWQRCPVTGGEHSWHWSFFEKPSHFTTDDYCVNCGLKHYAAEAPMPPGGTKEIQK